MFGQARARHRGDRASRQIIISVLIALGLLVMLALPPSATAGIGSGWSPLFEFNTTGSPLGELTNPEGIAIDQAGSFVYVVDLEKIEVEPGVEEFRHLLHRFNLAGEPVPFSSTGKSWLVLGSAAKAPLWLGGLIAVDNYGPNQGRIYALSAPTIGDTQSQELVAYSPSGEYLWALDEGLEFGCGLAVDKDGHPWIGRRDFSEHAAAIELAATGSPPAKIGSFSAYKSNACDIDLDASGNFFARFSASDILERYKNEEWQELGLKVDSNSLGVITDFTIDQSTPDGHFFTIERSGLLRRLAEYSSDNKLLASGGEDAIGPASAWIAYASGPSRLYVASQSHGNVIAFGFVSGTVPDVSINSALATGPTTAHFTGTVNPAGVNSSWHFEWKRHDESWQAAKSSPGELLPADEADHHVSFDATGLIDDEIYDARLVGANTDLGLKSVSGERTFSHIPVKVTTLPPAPRTDTTARLNARIYPAGNPATYEFEYSSDGANWTPLPQRTAPESLAGEVVAEELEGLKPGTTYHYRVNAESTQGPATPQGQERTFTTRTSVEMEPPRRGIELVSAPDKGNQNVLVPSNMAVPPMTVDGERVIWAVTGGAPGAPNGTANSFLAERTASGWLSRAIAPPAAQQLGEGVYNYEFKNATPAFDRFYGLALSSGGVKGGAVRVDDGQSQDVLATFQEKAGYGIDAEITTSGDRVVLINPETHQLEDIGSGHGEVVGLMPNGSPPSCGMDLGAGFTGYNADGGASLNARPGYRMIAATDASRIYFQAKANGKCNGAYGLYVRNRNSEETTLIDGKSPNFIRATPDGKQAYFKTTSKLDPTDKNTGNDVYLWDEESASSTCLTCVATPNAQVSGLPALVSDDFSHIYFQSDEQLAPGAPPGVTNLYVLRNGEISFVAQTAVSFSGAGHNTDAALSSNGEMLLFLTNASRALTADEMPLSCVDWRGQNSSCRQLYRYSDQDGSLECLSCNPNGTTVHPVGTANSTVDSIFRASEDGGTVVFATQEKLLPTDVNNDTDIYEWRNGVLQLITDGVTDFGTGEAAPGVYALSGDGRDILFSVAQPGLTGFERDGLASAYDARIGGGFAVPSLPAHCSEESCQGPLLAPPPIGHPGSSSLNGAGNVEEARQRRHCAGKRSKAKRRCLGKKPRHKRTRRHAKQGKGK